MLEAIVFDFDGVIVDSEPLHHQAFDAVLRPQGLGFDYERYLERYLGYDDRDAFAAIMNDAGMPPLTPDRLRELMDAKQQAFNKIAANSTHAIPGSVAMIQQASRVLPVGICSGATYEDINLMLSALAIGDEFSTVVAANDVAKSKPDPEGYALAVERLSASVGKKIAAEHCLAIEDTAAGIESAKGAGLMTLGLTTTGPASLLAKADRVVENLVDISVDTLKAWYND